MNKLDSSRYKLTKQLLAGAGLWDDDMERYLQACTFEAQNDGGMGSFSILSDKTRTGSRDYAETEYIDADGLKIIIALIGDEDGYPTDVDFWKVDSTALVRFPNAADLIVRAT